MELISDIKEFYIVKDGNYLYIRYSNDGGTTFTSNEGLDVGQYQGILVTNIRNIELNPELFTWSKREGIYSSDIEPNNPYPGLQWADTSVVPSVLKVWSGNDWIDIGNYSNDLEQIKSVVKSNTSEIMQNKDSIEGIIRETTVTVDDQDVSIKEYAESIRADLDGLTNTLTVREGNNLVRDSIGCFNDGSWTGDYNLDSTNEVRVINGYGYALLLKNDTISQNINVSNGTYTLSFKYKKHINLANARLKINDAEFVLSNNEITDFIYTFEVTSGIVELSFTTDTDNSCTIINLMLNKGIEKLEWSFNKNETWSDTVKIGRGVRISSSGTDVQFVAYADIIGFVDKNGNYITTFDKSGMVTDEIVVKNKATIVKLLIQDINGQTTINRIEE